FQMKLHQSPNSKRGRSGGTTIAVVVAIGLALIVLPAIGVLAVGVLHNITDSVNQVVNGGPQTTFSPQLTLSQVGAWQGTQRLNILVLGIDQRPNEDPN